ncbi:hypothetical protein [Natronosalvus amylolyticus]|uniref:hypothetical protein n=1 Tax=Natronosalvus amylolyticus TaxID=2961994 RepID=UPI0020C97C5D|nr:hypothetical protein [Natronosalvus amylolyticus]
MTNGIFAQQKIIREEHVDEEIPINFYKFGKFHTLLISIDYIKCKEPRTNWRYNIKKALLGSDGDTFFKMTLVWKGDITDYPHLVGIEISRVIEKVREEDDFNGIIFSSGFGKQNIEIRTSRPPEVDRQFSKFIDLLQEGIENEFDRIDDKI